MDGELIKNALCFHGKPMQKIWDDERGAGDLQKAGVPEDGNYALYMDRQKYFTFQDRAKRLKLHQFLARKALDLYDRDLGKSLLQSIRPEKEIEIAKQFVAEVPPYETFIVKHQDKVKRHIYESIKPGDIMYATASRNKVSLAKFGISVNPVCTGEPKVQLLHTYKLKASISGQFCGTIAADQKPRARGSTDNNEYLRCEVIEFSIDAERVTLSVLGNSTKLKDLKLGLITFEEMPLLYRKISENALEKFDDCLRKAKEFENPNYEVLYTINGLDIHDNFSLMTNLKYEFPQQEYAKELRQVQASKWAFRSVAEGIEYFKIGEHVEAFQCLNKALNIDPRNVEGLVARGALYANKGSFLKAVEDFEKALKLNAYHVNARKYMGETLVALGRSYEDDNRVQEAAKAYRDCLNIIPNHEQARMSLESIQQRTGATVEPLKKQLPLASKIENALHKMQDFEQTVTLPSSSNEEESSEGSSDTETEASDEQFLMSKKDQSLSPLSKKMALHSANEFNQAKAQFHQPFYMTQAPPSLAASVNVMANIFKLDDDDTESRVQKLLEEAMKHKKEKKKSKKSKKTKKSKKSTKSSPKKTTSILEKIDFQEAYNILGGGLKIESTLNDNLKMYEQTIQEIRKRQDLLHQSTSTTSEVSSRHRQRLRSATPPPPPPSLTEKPTSSTYVFKSMNFGSRNNNFPSSTATKVQVAPEPPKLSFQIKKPVKVDKFGLIRLATPVLEDSPTPSPPGSQRRSQSPRSRRRSRSPSRGRGRAGFQRRYSRSRSPRNRGYRGGARYRGRRRRSSSSSRSRSRSKSNSRHRSRRHRSRSNSRSSSRRRSPSPFVGRGTPSPSSRYRRSRSPRFRGRRSRSPRGRFPPAKFGNRIWKRPDFKPRVAETAAAPSDGKWLHDKFEDKNDGPSIEEIDEIIIKAQKERKQDIINRDKDILKKTSN